MNIFSWKDLVKSPMFVGAELELSDGFGTDRGPLAGMEVVGDRVEFSWVWCASTTLETYLWEPAESVCCQALITDVPMFTPRGCIAIPLRSSPGQRSTIILTPKGLARHKPLTQADIAKPWELLIAQNPQAQYDERVFERVMVEKMVKDMRSPDVADGCLPGMPFVMGAFTLHRALGGLKHDSDKLGFVQHYIEATKDRPVELTPY